MLAKAITPLPAAKDEVVDGEVVRHATLADPETRYRQRYADLAVNPEVRRDLPHPGRSDRARCASSWTSAASSRSRRPSCSRSTAARRRSPFVTHHNQLHQDLYLRISFELYLKRLLVGGFERVYEIGRDFRNEGVSFKHNPEFTQLEFYMAYADYLQVMELTEQMVAYTAQTGARHDADHLPGPDDRPDPALAAHGAAPGHARGDRHRHRPHTRRPKALAAAMQRQGHAVQAGRDARQADRLACWATTSSRR